MNRSYVHTHEDCAGSHTVGCDHCLLLCNSWAFPVPWTSRQVTDTYNCNVLNDFFFYIQGMEQPEFHIDCFQYPHCEGWRREVMSWEECCFGLKGMSYGDHGHAPCSECPWGKVQLHIIIHVANQFENHEYNVYTTDHDLVQAKTKLTIPIHANRMLHCI